MVSGNIPFRDYCKAELLKKITKGAFDLNTIEFNLVSDECKELITHMLATD